MTRIFIATIATMLLTTACGDAAPIDDAANRVEPPIEVVNAASKADAPGWFNRTGGIASNMPVHHRFSGSDSAHLYRYVAVEGHRLNLSASAEYYTGRGLALAVYDPKGDLVDWAVNRTGNEVSLEVIAELAGTYEVGVFSWSWEATGDYRLDLGVPCGSRGLTFDCGAGSFCQHPLGAICGWADAPGVCSVPPVICTTEAIPVCGCDGQTYTNGCRANAASVSVNHEGLCEDSGGGGNEPADGTACTSNAQCAESSSCQGVPQYMDGGEGCCTDTTPLDGQGAGCQADGDCNSGLLCIAESCAPDWMAGSFTSTPNTPIPDNDIAGASDTIVVGCLGSVPVKVRADITIRHTWIGDLTVTVADPSGDVVTTVHARSGDDADDLVLKDVAINHSGDDAVNGPWTLRVVDGAGQDLGTISSWTLHLTSRWD